MTLHATTRLLNLKKSIDSHLSSALAETGIQIDWEGLIQDLSQATEVVQPRLSLGHQDNMGQGPDGLGQDLYWRLSLNIFIRSKENVGRLAEIRDLLAEAFRPGGRVPFYDFEADPPELIDHLVVHRLTADQGLVSESGHLQHNLTILGHLVQQWSG